MWQSSSDRCPGAECPHKWLYVCLGGKITEDINKKLDCLYVNNTCSSDFGSFTVGIMVDHSIYIVSMLINSLCSNPLISSIYKELQYTIICNAHAKSISCPQFIQVDQPVVLLCKAVGESVM